MHLQWFFLRISHLDIEIGHEIAEFIITLVMLVNLKSLKGNYIAVNEKKKKNNHSKCIKFTQLFCYSSSSNFFGSDCYILGQDLCQTWSNPSYEFWRTFGHP